MIIKDNHGYEAISSYDELQEYLGLQNNIRLRYIVGCSLNGEISVRAVIPDRSYKYELLVFDYKEQTYSCKIIDTFQNQSLKNIVSSCVLRESGLRTTSIIRLGDLIENDSQELPNYIYPVIVPQYYKSRSYEPIYENRHRIGPPVWISRDVLPFIFEKTDNKESIIQFNVYQRAKCWYKNSGH